MLIPCCKEQISDFYGKKQILFKVCQSAHADRRLSGNSRLCTCSLFKKMDADAKWIELASTATAK